MVNVHAAAATQQKAKGSQVAPEERTQVVKMNVYRLIADMSHLFAMLLLLFKMFKSQSCAGVSGKSQVLYTLVFISRYCNVVTVFISVYNTVMKFLFITISILTVFLIYYKYRTSYDSSQDTFRVEILLVAAGGLALCINYEFSFLEIMWAFSIYLESVAIIPQFFMIHKTGQMEMFTYHYLFTLGLYRAFYIFNWVHRYRYEGYYDSIKFWSGCLQTFNYCYFLYSKQSLKRQAHAHFLQYQLLDTIANKDDEETGDVCTKDTVHSDKQKPDHVNNTVSDQVDNQVIVTVTEQNLANVSPQAAVRN